MSVVAAGLPEASQLFRQGQNAQALDKVNSYLSGNPKDPQGRFLKGLILAELNRTQDAIKTFNDLTNDYPELPEPYNNLAVLYASQGQYDKAKGSLEKAIRTHPTYATAHENLGDIYAKMASAAYDKALQLDKGNASAQMKLALVKDIFTPAGATKPRPAAAKPTPAAVETPAATVVAAVPVAKAPAAAGSPEKAVEDWAAAWARRDVPAYLSFYADSFRAPNNMSREAWQAQREERISRASFIKVELSNIKVSGDAKQATATFNQRYESNLLNSSTRKTLSLVKQDNGWKIASER